jgi:hypothetical protein
VAKGDYNERCHPTTFGIVSFKGRPASIWILQTQEQISRFSTSSHLIHAESH